MSWSFDFHLSAIPRHAPITSPLKMQLEFWNYCHVAMETCSLAQRNHFYHYRAFFYRSEMKSFHLLPWLQQKQGKLNWLGYMYILDSVIRKVTSSMSNHFPHIPIWYIIWKLMGSTSPLKMQLEFWNYCQVAMETCSLAFSGILGVCILLRHFHKG